MKRAYVAHNAVYNALRAVSSRGRRGRRTLTTRKHKKTAREFRADGNFFRRGRYVLCGALIGAGAILPGVSGGALAVAFGVYRPFMDILTRPKAALREHRGLLAPFALGWTAGFFLLARLLNAAMSVSETACAWLFVGLIAGSVPALWREAGKEGRPASSRAWFALCAFGLCAGFYCVRHVLHVQAAPNFWWRNFCGVLWGAGTVLPGFGASPIMMALGLYQPILDDLSRFDAAALAACLPGAVLSAGLLARGVNRLFRLRYADAAHGVLGLVCASALSMVPAQYGSAAEIVWSGLCGGCGFLLTLFAERTGRKAEDSG